MLLGRKGISLPWFSNEDEDSFSFESTGVREESDVPSMWWLSPTGKLMDREGRVYFGGAGGDVMGTPLMEGARNGPNLAVGMAVLNLSAEQVTLLQVIIQQYPTSIQVSSMMIARPCVGQTVTVLLSIPSFLIILDALFGGERTVPIKNGKQKWIGFASWIGATVLALLAGIGFYFIGRRNSCVREPSQIHPLP
ncbi:hypothetical protein M0R45_013834 [Rubus argutus]|uniref:Uncharacterized protein n=1 Tax=Rubus argutus TaxID=59490 RepID=A0AAW1XL82_RUBAR